MLMRLTAISILMALLTSPAALHAAPQGTDLVKATLLADTSAVQPGRSFHVGVLLKLAPKWHVYWSNSGDAGIPTTVDFHLPEGFTASAVQYPVPIRIEQSGGIVMFGYSDEVMLLATITPPQEMNPRNVTIAADVNWLVCDEQTCNPGSAKVNLILPLSDSAKATQTELFESWTKRLPVSAIQSSHVSDCRASVSWLSTGPAKASGEVSIKIDWKNGAPSQMEWFPPARDGFQFGKPQVQTDRATTTIKIPFERFGQTAQDKPLDSVLGFKTPEGYLGLSIPIAMSDVR